MLKETIKTVLNTAGFDLVRYRKPETPSSTFTEYSEANKQITDAEKLARLSETIPGMIEPRSGQNLYQLCYMQQLEGDVVEIGSWQGRSTLFLGNAVRDSGNGRLYAIDHFRGNIGKEEFYEVDGSLENLDKKFKANIERCGLTDFVELLDMPSEQAAARVGEVDIRFLFIDGDHTYEGVKRDIQLFFPRLLTGAIVVFDDYFSGFPGLIEAVEELVIQPRAYSKIYYYRHTLVVEYQK